MQAFFYELDQIMVITTANFMKITQWKKTKRGNVRVT